MLLTQQQQEQTTTIVDQQIGFHTTTQQLLFNPLLNSLPFNNNRNNKRPFSSLFSDNDPFTAALHTSNNSSSQQQTKTTLPQKKRINSKKPRVYTSAAYLAKFPNPNRSSSQIDCGEDAFFINHYHGGGNGDENDENDDEQSNNNNHTRPIKRRRIMSMGVSDGVGGYSRWVLNGKRVDPSEMAWALMDISKQQLSSSAASLVCNNNSLMTPKQALIHAYNDIIDNEKVSIGGATACIVALDQVYLDDDHVSATTAVVVEMDDDTSSHNIQLTANGVVVDEDAGVVVSDQSSAAADDHDDDDNSNTASADQKNSNKNNTQQQRHAALKLSSANLGDSAFYVIRDGAVFYRSTDQTHYFNCPYQLSAPRESLPNILQDHPNMADEMIESLTILSNDVIIVASDGLTDNVFDEEVARIVLNRMNQVVETKKENDDVDEEKSDSTEEEEKKNDQSKTSMELKDVAQAIAHDILHRAVLVSRSTHIETPFQKYSALHGLDFPGGKPDDITVCVCVVE